MLEVLDSGMSGHPLANRLRKNLKHLSRWLQREHIDCYRLYDADLPEYALAIDVYQGDRRWVHVQEYAPPPSIDPEKAQARLQSALTQIRDVLQVPDKDLFLKRRQQQKGASQYQRLAATRRYFEVREHHLRFLVNFEDHLDTGLFLDHRLTRKLLAELAPRRRFLNLFAYTGSASVYAAAGGAVSTTTLDMSKTYIAWARRNLALNGIRGKQHRLLQTDCVRWLQHPPASAEYDLIFLDPPSFSSSKRMAATFDVQRDHVPLLRQAAGLLAPEGILIFSNNRRHFKMDTEALGGLNIENISHQTLPNDFARNPRIHNCWRVQRA